MTALDNLARARIIADPDATASINVGDFFTESEAGVASLQANGFYVRIARRGAERKEKGKITVLAIEDDPALTKLLKMYLQMEDFVVRIAATRADITKALREPPKPDIVLLDVTLPDADGFDILKKMRAHEAMKTVPIIMATAKASREAVLNGLKGGADGYVTKPYDMEVLLKAIRSVLGIGKK
jgi:two-component system, OmpR family, response regulator